MVAYYDPRKPAVLQMDASTQGLVAVLIQQNKPIYFASKAPQESQKKCVVIELEALAMSWAVKKFHHYLYGQMFTLETDQRPLVSILSKNLLEALPRMQWLLMKTVPYDMTVKYIPGTTNTVADYLSRVPIKTHTIQLPFYKYTELQITSDAQLTDSNSSMKRLHKMTLWLSSSMLCIQAGLRKFKTCQWDSNHTGHSMKKLPLRMV